MTPFRNDSANPYARESLWPGLPQTPLSLGGRTQAAFAVVGNPADEGLFFDSHDFEFEAPEAPAEPVRRGLKPMPALAAAVVGVMGLATLYLAIGLPV